jgi:broad specificity phosphatase PhoE
MRGGAGFRFPGGESLQEHSDRVWAALQDIRAEGPLPALVVCHRGSIRAVLCRSDPRGLDAFHEYDVPNTGVVEL